MEQKMGESNRKNSIKTDLCRTAQALPGNQMVVFSENCRLETSFPDLCYSWPMSGAWQEKNSERHSHKRAPKDAKANLMDTNEPQVEDKLNSDCYSAGERAWMEYGQQLRAYCLNPLLEILGRCRVTPDAVTIASGLCGAAFLPLWLVNQPVAALFCLLMHVLLDGLDGPLARHQGTASPRGSFVDTFTDQVVVTLVTVAWIIRSPSSLNIAFGGSYIFLYAMVVGMAMVRNALEVPYSWLVRPRFFVFVAIAIEWLIEWPLALTTLVVCDLLLAIKCASGFLALRAKLPGPNLPD